MEAAELKALRLHLDLSIADAARQVEVNQRTWARWEAGEREVPPSVVKLFRILNGLEKAK